MRSRRRFAYRQKPGRLASDEDRLVRRQSIDQAVYFGRDRRLGYAKEDDHTAPTSTSFERWLLLAT